MKREVFVKNMREIDVPMPETEMKKAIREHGDSESDLPICIGELSELILELTRFQRNKMNMDDFLQELSHVQWTVWTLQNMFNISDETVRKGIQASFRWN